MPSDLGVMRTFASVLVHKISVALAHSCQHLIKTKFMTSSSFANLQDKAKHPLMLGTGLKNPQTTLTYVCQKIKSL